ACSASQSRTRAPQRSSQSALETKAVAPTGETRSPVPPAPAHPHAQSPPTQPQAQAPECATTLRPHTNDESPQADAPNSAHQHRTKPPAPSPQPQAKVAPPPPAPVRKCTPHAPPHQGHKCQIGRASRRERAYVA